MSSFKLYWGAVVPNQKRLSLKYCSLLGESPRCDAILASQDLDGAVVFDGKTWRELDLAAMQETSINHGRGDNPEYDKQEL